MSAFHDVILVIALALAVALTITWDGALGYGLIALVTDVTGSTMYRPANDAHLVFLVLSCLAVITLGSLVTALTRVRRAEFARLRNEVSSFRRR